MGCARPAVRRISFLLLSAALPALLALQCRPDSADRSTDEQSDSATTRGEDDRPVETVCDCDRPASFSDAVERVRPAVVNLYSANYDDSAEDDSAKKSVEPEERADRNDSPEIDTLGSGVIVDEEGHVITNHHVVEGSEHVRARLLDGRWFETRRVGTDRRTDLALLQLVEADDVPTAPFGDSAELEVGDWVIAIGNPAGLNSTVTVGITSGIGRSNLQLSKELDYQDFIQTDASINPGNSGGPLVDAEGRVVGINTVVSARAQGIGFAIPSALVQKELHWLERGGEVGRSWLGLYVDEVPEALRERIDLDKSGAALVTGVVDGGPADTAGIQEGDVLLEVGDTEVDGLDHLTWMAGRLRVGEPTAMRLQRGSEGREVELTPKPPPESPDESAE